MRKARGIHRTALLASPLGRFGHLGGGTVVCLGMALSRDALPRMALTGAVLSALVSAGAAQGPNQLYQLDSIEVYRNGIDLDWYVMPGAALAAAAFDRIDANRDGAVSEAEGRAYAKRALRDIALTVDGEHRTLLVRRVSISDRRQMLTGAGSIDCLVYVVLPERLGRHTLAFENRHRRTESRFTTATLNDPADESVRIVSPRQGAGGARLELTYVVAKAPTFRPGPPPFEARPGDGEGVVGDGRLVARAGTRLRLLRSRARRPHPGP